MEQIVRALVQETTGQTIAETCRCRGVITQTFYAPKRWPGAMCMAGDRLPKLLEAKLPRSSSGSLTWTSTMRPRRKRSHKRSNQTRARAFDCARDMCRAKDHCACQAPCTSRTTA